MNNLTPEQARNIAAGCTAVMQKQLEQALLDASGATERIAQVAYEAIADATGIFAVAWDEIPQAKRGAICKALNKPLTGIALLGGFSHALESVEVAWVDYAR